MHARGHHGAPRTRPGAAALLLLGLLVAPVPLAAQAPEAGAEAPAAKPEAPPPEPEAPALPEVAAAIETTEKELRAMARLARPVAAITAIEEKLDGRIATIDEGLARTAELLEGELDLAQLRDFEAAWIATQRDLREWREALTRRATDLETRVAELDALRTRWDKTRTRAREENAPQALRARIDELRAEIRKTQETIGGRRSEVLTLQSRVAEEEEKVAEIVNDLRLQKEQRRSQLLHRDAPPLWQLFPVERGALVPPIAIGSGVQDSVQAIQRRPDGAVGHAFFALVTLALLLRLGRQARRWPAEDPRQSSAVVWERPFATTLLIALIAAPWFYAYIPELFRHGFALAVVVALLRIIPPLLPEILHPALYTLTGFYVVDRLRALLASAPVGERLVFLLETAVAAGLLLALLRPARVARLPRDAQLPPGTGLLLRLAAAALVVSVVANVLGFLGLARVVGEGVLRAAYLAVLLYGGLRVARALLRVALQSRALSRLNMVRRHRALLMRRIDRLLEIGFALLWGFFLLELFALREVAADAGRSLLEASVTFGTITLSVGDGVAFGITVFVAIWIARSLTFVLDEDVFPRVTMQRGIPGAISATARYAILFGGFLLAAAAAGVDFERFTILAGALGVGIGFGLQNIVNNFVSGLILLYERPIQVGDAVQMQDLFGEVKRIGIRSSTVRTWDGAEVIVPNADLISSQVTNWTLSDRNRRMNVKVGVAYGSDPEVVLDILRRVARDHPDVLDEPPPFARFVGFGDSSLDFELWAFTGRFERFWPAVNDVLLAIHAGLREAGIEIPFPQRDLHLRSTDPEAARLLRGAPPPDAGPVQGAPGAGGAAGEPAQGAPDPDAPRKESP